MKVVFVGADPRIAEIATLALHPRWPETDPLVATTAVEGLELVEEESPDIVILHPDFTDMSLYNVIQELRRFSNVPLLVLSHRRDELEVVTSLGLGADDYIRLPCGLIELSARLGAFLRRVGIIPSHKGEAPLLIGQMLFEPSSHAVFFDDQKIALTITEFRMLYLLARNWNTVIPYLTLKRALWGEDGGSSKPIKRHVHSLRQKLGDDARKPHLIASVPGVGYRFIGPPPAPATR